MVDNGSTDGSDAAVAARLSRRCGRLRTEANLGISGGLNLGFRVGLDEGYDYLLAMNNDIEVAPDLLTELVRRGRGGSRRSAASDPSATTSSATATGSGRPAGVLRFREAVTRERGMGELDRGQYDPTGGSATSTAPRC